MFDQILHSVWGQDVEGFPMFRVYMKLKKLNLELRRLNQKAYSHIYTRFRISKEELVAQQHLIQQGAVDAKLGREGNSC